MDTIVYRKGSQSLPGKIRNKSFSIVTDLGTLKVPTKKIAHILINVAAYGGKDQIFTYSSVLIGDVVEDPIVMRLADTGEDVSVPQNKILAIHIGN